MKKYLLPFGAGVGVFLAFCVLLVLVMAIWVSTIGASGRTWYFAGKEYSTAEMRQISLELVSQQEDRVLQPVCFNPEAHFKGYSGMIIDSSRGYEANRVFGEESSSNVFETVSIMNQLACQTVLPSTSTPVLDFVNTVITDPLVSVATSFIDNSASEG